MVNGIFLVVGEDKIILSSDDGISWEQINIEHSDVAFNDVVWNGKEYLIVGDKMRILTSEEGVDWEYNDDYMEVLKKELTDKNINSVLWHKDKFIAAGQDGIIMFSGDGRTWTEKMEVTKKSIMSLSTDGDRLVGVGKDGIIVVSESGENWENLTKLSAGEKQYTLLENEEESLQVLAKFPFDIKMDITRYIEYEVSDENVITLEKGDLIKALNAGQSAIKVFYDGKTLEIPITVEKQENNTNNDKESEKKDNDQKIFKNLGKIY